MNKNNIFNPHNCVKFTGYKPCAPYRLCEECDEPSPAGSRILLIALEAQGAVLMTTPLLHAIKREYPGSHVTWLTRPSAMPMLEHNHLIDRALPWNDENRLLLQAMEFDIVIALDKSVYTGAFMNTLKSDKKRGFGLSPEGVIIPLNEGAVYNYRLGINDRLKFRENRLTVSEIIHQTAELPYKRDRYILNLSPEESAYRDRWAGEAGIRPGDVVVAFNTGCSDLFPNKKLRVEQQVELINMLYEHDPSLKIVLVGGREDTERNALIYEKSGRRTINTPTTEGLRRGIVYEDIADVVISGDSLGMHIAIGLGKYVVAWFGLSCEQEIELFGRGEKILSGVECAPCWKKACDDLKCLDEISLQAVFDAAVKGVDLVRAEKAGQK